LLRELGEFSAICPRHPVRWRTDHGNASRLADLHFGKGGGSIAAGGAGGSGGAATAGGGNVVGGDRRAPEAAHRSALVRAARDDRIDLASCAK
jgi:hypothetical protein